MSAGLANRRGAEFSARIFSTNFQHADSQCTNFNSNNLRVLSPLVYNIYSVDSIELGPSDPIFGHVHLDGSLVRSLTAQRHPRTVSEVSAALISSGVVNLNASHQMDRQRPAAAVRLANIVSAGGAVRW